MTAAPDVYAKLIRRPYTAVPDGKEPLHVALRVQYQGDEIRHGVAAAAVRV